MLQQLQQSVASRFVTWPPLVASQANCSGPAGITGTQKAGAIIGTGGSIAAGTAIAAGAAAGSVVPVVGTIVGAIAGLIGSIFGTGHQKAVQAQSNALCSAVPAANQALQQIDAALASGQLTPAQAASMYTQLQAQFSAAMKAGTSYKRCDALYGYDLTMKFVIAARQADLQAGVLTGGAPGPWTATSPGSAATGSTAGGGISPLLLLLGGAALFLFV